MVGELSVGTLVSVEATHDPFGLTVGFANPFENGVLMATVESVLELVFDPSLKRDRRPTDVQ
jgi:hypothetical protein